MGRPYALLRAGFPYLKTLGMRRITSNPVDLALGREGRFYVLCRGSIQVEVRGYTFDDEDLGPIGGFGTEPGKFTWPAGITADENENLYVTDEALHRVSVFSKGGEFLAHWGEQGEAEGQLNRPSGIDYGPDGNLYISDTLNHRVQKFTREGKLLGSFGSLGDGEGQLTMPWGVAVDEMGDVYVADWRNDRIQKFSASGEPLMSIGRSGDGDGQLKRPSGVDVDQDGDIYVADRDNNRIQQFNSEGRYVDQFIGDATLSPSARQYILANPVTLRLRDISVLDPGKRLRGPVSVKVDAEGNMFVPDYGSHRVQVYKKEAYPLEENQIAPMPRNPTLATT